MKRIVSMSFVFVLVLSLFSVVPERNATATEHKNPFVNLGPQIKYTNTYTGEAGIDQNGTPLMYTVVQGDPAKLIVVDLRNNTVSDSKSLEGATGAWAIEKGKDHTVWIGTTPNEHLFQYNPNTKQLTKIGKATTSSNTVVWDLEYIKSSKTLFGGTSYGGDVFQYNKDGFTNLSSALAGKKYARSLTYYEKKNRLFVGLGSSAALISWDLSTGLKLDILPQQYRNESSVYDLNEAGGILFVKLVPSHKVVMLDANTYAYLGSFDANSRGVSDEVPGKDEVYYSNNGQLYRFDLRKRSSTPVESNLYGSSAVSFDFIELNSEKYPGITLVGLAGNGGRYYKYNLANGNFEMDILPLPPQPVEIHSIGNGVNGEIYSSGFISGDLGIYKPLTGDTTQYADIGQIEGMAQLNGKMFFGTYPGANIYSYNPSDTWKKNSNPKQIMSLKNDGQDRPVALLGIEEVGKLFIGTFPSRGERGGVLAAIDPETNQQVVRRNIINDQSIISLAYRKQDGNVFAGTSVYNGNGKIDEHAKLFTVPVDKPDAHPKVIDLPIGHPLLISALTVTPDGKLFGMADGKLFIYKNEGEAIRVIPIIGHETTGTARNAKLLVASDGNVYGTVEGKLFRVDTQTYKLTMLKNEGAYGLTQDQHGNLYFKNGTDLWKASLKDLVDYKAPEVLDLSIPHIELPTGHTLPIARLHVRKPVELLKEENGVYNPVKTLKANEFYRVYGTSGNYYHVGGGYYVYNAAGKVAVYIGRAEIKRPIPLYAPDGSVHRMLNPGEAIRVYDFDDEKYEVGGGYYILKSRDSSYFVGLVKIVGETYLHHEDGRTNVKTLDIGERYRVYKIDKDKIYVGGGYYIIWNKKNMSYSKN
ncbi:hypothetical protein ACTWQL_03710 [Pseudalkalibacillus sp. R45]|uniref:hypothetical protein n=1 Tax=Pseudalkalibacillus sp. R45 TaxID=3457433 RepID=UPI003FCEBA99